MIKGRSLIALSVFVLAACGQKGPLYQLDLEKPKNKQDNIQETTQETTQESTQEGKQQQNTSSDSQTEQSAGGN